MEEYDLEKRNFLGWYKYATAEDIEKAKRVNRERYEELLNKYKRETDVIRDGKK